MRPKTLRLSLLPALDAILNARTVSEAADNAHLTQPALSIALRKARDHFGDELVVYRSGGSELTELGAALRPRVRAALQSARDALDCELSFDPATTARTVTIMCNAQIELVFLVPLIACLHMEAPNLSIHVERFKQLPANPNLLEGIDFILASDIFATPEYSHLRLFRDRMVCMVWKEQTGIGSSINVEQMLLARHATTVPANDQIIASQRGPSLFRRLEAAHRYVLRTPSAAALPQMIVGTDVVITGSRRYCELFTRHLPLRLVEIVGDQESARDLDIDVAVLWKPHRSDEPFVKWLIGMFQLVAKKI